MASAPGIIAGVQAVGTIASKNSAKRREREAARAQQYYAEKKYESEKMQLDAQKQFQQQQQLLTQLQYQGVRLQEDFALKENEIQNLIQAANMRFQNQQQLLASQTKNEQLRAEGDRVNYQAGQQIRQLKGQALEESSVANTQMSREMSQLEAAIQKGDFEQAGMLALLAANGQDSSSLSTATMSANADAEQALMGLRGNLEGQRLNEQDLMGLVMSDEFGQALERLGLLQGSALQRQADTNDAYAGSLSAANAFNIDREQNLSKTTNDASRGILAGQRGLQDLALKGQGLMNDFAYGQGLTNAQIERSSGVQGAQMMSRNAKGAGLFDYLNAGYSMYQAGQPLFNRGLSTSVPSKTVFDLGTVNGFGASGFTDIEQRLAVERGMSEYQFNQLRANLSGQTTQIPGLRNYGY